MAEACASRRCDSAVPELAKVALLAAALLIEFVDTETTFLFKVPVRLRSAFAEHRPFRLMQFAFRASVLDQTAEQLAVQPALVVKSEEMPSDIEPSRSAE